MAFLRRVTFRGCGWAIGRWVSFWTLSIALLAVPAASRADTPIPAASQLKAVFLFNFGQFLTWPAGAFADPQSPIVIGILGDDPFGTYLDALVKGERIGNRPILIRRFQKVEEVTECHILFIDRSESADLDRVLAALKARPILTVGDDESFTRHGGMVAFVTQPNGKIGLRINNALARQDNLTISSRLLAHATLVTEAKD